jgi:hypothetical protein
MAEQFDMFSEQVPRDHVVTRGPSKSSKPDKPAIPMREENMVRHLSETGRYRILQRLMPRAIAPFPRPEYPLKGIILDTETTGLNARNDEIIEIGVIAFTFDGAGRIGDVTGIYGGLRQPGVSIPTEITRLTGITDDMVAGQTIDMAALEALIEPADLLIAHNAGFDRPFCEAFLTCFPVRPGLAPTPRSTGRRGGMKAPSSATSSGKQDIFMKVIALSMIVSHSWKFSPVKSMDRPPPLSPNSMRQARGRVSGFSRRTARSI